MKDSHHITLVIPALDEAPAIGQVLGAIPPWVDDIIVSDNGSTDATAAIAIRLGARVVSTPERGYGSACLGALADISRTDVTVFMDGDASCDPAQMHLLVDPIIQDTADVVIGARPRHLVEPGAMTAPQRFGNWLASTLIRWLWNAPVTDLGPYRAIRHSKLAGLQMADRDYGWTVELQLKAIETGLRQIEVPVSCRQRIGKSKISGTVTGVVGAGVKILSLIARHWWRRRFRAASASSPTRP